MTDGILANRHPSATRLGVFKALEPVQCAHAPVLLALAIEEDLNAGLEPDELFQGRTIRDLGVLNCSGIPPARRTGGALTDRAAL